MGEMLTFCKIVLTVVTCTSAPNTTRPTAAEAATILQSSTPPAVATWRREETDAILAGWRQGGTFIPPPPHDPYWPFSGTFEPTWMPGTRRLDGSFLDTPQVVYGLPYGYGAGFGAGYGYRARHSSGVYTRPASPEVRASAPASRPAVRSGGSGVVPATPSIAGGGGGRPARLIRPGGR